MSSIPVADCVQMSITAGLEKGPLKYKILGTQNKGGGLCNYKKDSISSWELETQGPNNGDLCLGPHPEGRDPPLVTLHQAQRSVTCLVIQGKWRVTLV